MPIASHPFPETLRRRGFTLLELAVVVAILAVLVSLVVMKVEKTQNHADETVARAALNTVREAFTGAAGAPGYLSDMKHVPGFNSLALRVHDLLDGSQYPDFASYDPVARRGWRGPYLDNAQPVRNTNVARNGLFPAAEERRFDGDATFLERHFYAPGSPATSYYGSPGDRVAADPWGNPIVVQVPPDAAFTNPTEAKVFRYVRLVSAGPDGILETPRDRLAGLEADGTTAARGDDFVIFLNRGDVYELEEP